jgi:membrane protease YdiL (CAAX protease family)
MPEKTALSTRAWWARLAVGCLLPCAVWLLVDAVAAVIFGAEYSLGSHIFRAVATTSLVVVAFALLLRWERSRAADYGVVVGAGMLRGLALGVVGYLVPFLGATIVIMALNLAAFDVPAGPLDLARQGLLVLVLVILYEAVPEELIFRGYLFQVLAERFSAWLTILLQALLFCAFGVIVGAAVTLDRILLFFVFSISLGYLRHVTGTVFATIGFHAVFQMLAQWSLGEQWRTLSVTDPGEWFALVALGIAPFALAPAVAALLIRWRNRPGLTG